MSKESKIDKYHDLAKQAGNKLRAYILSIASGGSGVIFLALIKYAENGYSSSEKFSLFVSLVLFSVSALLCLYELRIDAKRFYSLATELEKAEEDQDWTLNEKYKSKRQKLINYSYITLMFGILGSIIFLIQVTDVIK